jgi:cysteine desulfurase/selenocysteine lyase
MSIPVIPDILPARPTRPAAGPMFDVKRVRDDFPILRQKVRGKPLVYLDNAATAQKPLAVLEALQHYYVADNANVHRGVHLLSERATQEYEDARAKAKDFLHAADVREVVFVRGATEAINLVAQAYGRKNVREGDEILITAMEHHSNIVPWQMLCEEKGAKLRVAPIDDHGELLLDEFEKLLTPRTKIASVVHVSNTLGTVNPVRRVVEAAHARGVPVLVDGAQSAPHMPVNVRDLGCDFFVFSGHKLFGPTGVGVLYGRETLLEAMPPWQGGGDMIRSVSFEKTTWNTLPYKFEAGTPNIAGVVGLGAAIDYLHNLDWEVVAAHEHDLLTYATAALSEIPGLRVIGTARDKAAVVSFTLEGVHPHDVGTVLDLEGIAIRTGHHCTQPLMDRFGVPATARASFAFYNTREEVDALVKGMHKVQEVFG